VPAAYPPSTARLLWNAYCLPLQAQATSINIPMNTQDRHTEKLKLREFLTAEVVADLEQEIDDVLACESYTLAERDRKAIRDRPSVNR
jgi:hypothetical protein